MRNKFARRTALLLAFLMLFSAVVFASCEKEEQPDTTKNDRWQLSDEPGRPSTPDKLPENLDLEGYEASILYRKQGDWINYYECEGSIVVDENYNNVYSVVYERNKTVEWRLNCKLTWNPTNGGTLDETTAQVKRIIQIQEYYDFINSTNNTMVANGLNALLCDLGNTMYIDLKQPWWWSEINNILSVDNKSYHYIVGDMNVLNILKMSAFYFNTELVKTMLNKDKEYMYGLVDDKKWTLEQVYTMVKNLYKDTTVNPNMTNQRDQGDIFGLVHSNSSETVNQFLLSTKVAKNTYTRDENGMVTLKIKGNEDVIRVAEILKKLLFESEGSWKASTGFDDGMIKEFSEGNYVFFPQRLSAVQTTYMRTMTTDYGILPYPTLDEGDEYISDIQSSATSICVQAVVDLADNLDTVSAIIEALNAEAYRYTTVAVYELALKAKYARDDDASRMIDLIYESANKSFIVEYEGCCNQIIYKIVTTISRNNGDVASTIDSLNDNAQKSIDAFITRMIKDIN